MGGFNGHDGKSLISGINRLSSVTVHERKEDVINSPGITSAPQSSTDANSEISSNKKLSMNLSTSQLEILQHSLGVDKYGRGEMYRNFFCAGGDDEPTCRELVGLGLMRQHPTTETYPYFNCSVTELGKQAVREQSPKPPKLTRSQQRYRRFLDADSGLSFGEWLRIRRRD